MGARHYDPRTGAFLQPDPLGIAAVATYAYAANNPYRFVDPSGLDPFSIAGDFGFSFPASSSSSAGSGFDGSFFGELAEGARAGSDPRPSPPVSDPGSVGGAGGFTTGSTLGFIGGVPVGGFVSGQIDNRGRLSSEAGLGIAAGNLAALTAQGVVNVSAGTQSQFEFGTVVALGIPNFNFGFLIDARISLNSFGGRAQAGAIRGGGVLGFIGVIKQGPSLEVGNPSGQ